MGSDKPVAEKKSKMPKVKTEITLTENGEQVRLGSIYTRAFLDSHQGALEAMKAITKNHTYNGCHIL